MTDLDDLRPEVRHEVECFDKCYVRGEHSPEWCDSWRTLRAELLRLHALERELDEEIIWQVALRFDELIRAERAEAELAALKARIAEAKRVRLGTYPAHGSGYVQIIAEPREGDKTYRLLVEE